MAEETINQATQETQEAEKPVAEAAPKQAKASKQAAKVKVTDNKVMLNGFTVVHH